MSAEYSRTLDNYYRLAKESESHTLVFAGEVDALAFAVYVENRYRCRPHVDTAQDDVLGDVYEVTLT